MNYSFVELRIIFIWVASTTFLPSRNAGIHEGPSFRRRIASAEYSSPWLFTTIILSGLPSVLTRKLRTTTVRKKFLLVEWNTVFFFIYSLNPDIPFSGKGGEFKILV
jgi:hypothetical protein